MAKNKIVRYDKALSTKIESGLETWVNQETGEIREFQTIDKIYYGQKHFWKLYLQDFLAVLGIVESRQLDVICYIMDNTTPSNNIFIGTMEQIAKNVGCSKGTVNEAIKKLKAAKFMTVRSSGVYQVNPEIMVKGSEAKKRNLVIAYNEADADPRNNKQLNTPATTDATIEKVSDNGN